MYPLMSGRPGLRPVNYNMQQLKRSALDDDRMLNRRVPDKDRIKRQ